MTLPRLAASLAILAIVIAPASAVAVTKTDRKQNRAIKKLDTRSKAAARQLGALTSDVAGLKGGLPALQGTVASLQGALDSTNAAVAELTSGLTGVRGALDGYAAATEYGFVQLYFDPEGNGFEADDAVPAQLLVSGDVPDDKSQATVAGKLVLAVPDGTTAKSVALRAGLRSGEKDGTGASNPAGVAGLMAMSGSMNGPAGSTFLGGGNPGAGGALPLTSAPNGALGGMPAYPIPDKAPRDSSANPLSVPYEQTIELTDPATLQTLTGAPGRFTVSNTSGAPAFAIFDVTVRFHDLSASATDLEE